MKPRHLSTLVILAGCLAAAAASAPQDPASEHIFPPDLIMRHQAELALTDGQRQFIMGEIQKFQEQMAGHHQALGEAQAKLTALVRKEPTDETNTLAQLDEVMKQEREIKRAQ
jgi:Spy/CpxP family protein refolding chaperone